MAACPTPTIGAAAKPRPRLLSSPPLTASQGNLSYARDLRRGTKLTARLRSPTPISHCAHSTWILRITTPEGRRPVSTSHPAARPAPRPSPGRPRAPLHTRGCGEPWPSPATAATMDECIKVLTSFPPTSEPLKTDKAYHDAITAHTKALDSLVRKHQSTVCSKAEQILSVRRPLPQRALHSWWLT